MSGPPDLLAHTVLGCSRCGASPLRLDGESAICAACGWTLTRSGRIFSDSAAALTGSFDQLFDGLDAHNHHPVVWDLCYRRQCAHISEAISARMAGRSEPAPIVLDIGCGPTLPYTRPEGSLVVGVEPSLPALRANTDVDLALHTSAAALPIGDGTIDILLAIYAIHHMIGRSIAESWSQVVAAFGEMARVARPGATVVMLEVCPWRPVWPLERVGWTAARRLAGAGVDFVFWPESRLAQAGRSAFPGATLTAEHFGVPAWSTFPPIIATPRFRVPRFLYPFTVTMLTWTLPG